SILLARRDAGISNIQDLVGKRVMLLPEDKDADILVSFLNEGVSLDAIHRLDQTYNLDDLIEGRTDAVSAYMTNEPWQLLQQGVEPAVISPQNSGVDFYSDCLFTTEIEIRKQPRRVQAFLDASLLGWEYAMTHSQEIIDLLIAEYGVKKQTDQLSYEAETIRKMMLPELVQIGHMNPGRWRHITEVYQKLGILDDDFSLEGFLYDPGSQDDFAWLNRTFFAAIFVIVLLAAGTGFLVVFNRRLRSEVQDRKQAEEEIIRRELTLNKIFDVLPIGLWFADKNGKLLRGNPAGVKIWGAEPTVPIEEYGVFKARRLPSGEEIAPDEWALAHTIQKGVTVTDELLEIDAFDGQKKIILNYTAPVINDSGEMLGAIVVNNDITHHKQADAEREKLQEQLNQAQKMESVGRLAGGVAHDFNNMLGVILGHTELALLKADEDNDLISDLKEIQTAATRSADITKQLLAFARKQVISPRQLDLNDTVESMLNMLRRLIGEDIDLVWQPSAHLWPVKMDPTQIDQILANLCVNARDAISGVGKLTIETGRQTFNVEYCNEHPGFIPGDFVLLAVSDNGCGMDKDTLDNLFEPFFTTKDIGKGTGLGLATVFGIVKQNNGFINVYSEPEKGSSFRIYLPRHTADMAEKIPDKHMAPPQRGSGETILIVEDEATILEMLETMLESLNYTIITAASPSRAMEMAHSHAGQIHLVITDVVMPEMNGRDLAEKLSALYPDINILFMSGYTADVIAHQGILDDGVAFIQKPFSMADLGEKVRAVLDKASDETQLSNG
ncbi:MAG: ABC transporter substrate-binding protein, partial [Desulfotignum sp.]